MRKLIAAATLLTAFAMPTAAFAYIGPGAGLSLIGALWALLLALGTAIAFLLAWPLRKMLRRRRDNAAQARQVQGEAEAATVRSPSESASS